MIIFAEAADLQEVASNIAGNDDHLRRSAENPIFCGRKGVPRCP